MRKTSRVLTPILATVLLASPFLPPNNGQAGAAAVLSRAAFVDAEYASSKGYWVTIERITGGPDSDPGGLFYANSLVLTGSFGATQYSGTTAQYHIEINWGDLTPLSDLWPLQFSSSDNKSFTGAWTSPPHTYAHSGNYTVAATLYHQQIPGAEKSDPVTETVQIKVIVPPAIAGVVYNDLDADGVREPGEPGIPGVSVMIEGPEHRSVVTGPDGLYISENLSSGTYRITEATPAGYLSINPPDDVIVGVTAQPDTVARADFGDCNTIAVIRGIVFDDLNANGLKDGGETNIAGVRVVLGGASAGISETDTAGFVFIARTAGAHTLTETDPLGFYSTTPNSIDIPNVALGYAYGPYLFGDASLASCNLTLQPPSVQLQLPNQTQQQFSVTLVNHNGSPVSGVAVTIESSFGNLNSPIIITGPDGRAGFTISSNSAGEAHITATASPLFSSANCTWLAPPPLPPGGGGGGGPIPPPATPSPTPTPAPSPTPEPPATTAEEPVRYFTVDFLGRITSQRITQDGRLTDDLNAPSPDGASRILLTKDTQAVAADGEIVTSIKIEVATEVPALPADTVLVSNAYDFTPSGLTFDGKVTITLGYEVTDLPEDASGIRMAAHTPATGWVDLQTASGMAAVGSISSNVQHFSVFAVLASVGIRDSTTVSSKPIFAATNLSIAPSHTVFWSWLPVVTCHAKDVTIAADAINSGTASGIWELSLKIDGKTRQTLKVPLEASQTKAVTYRVANFLPGTHNVELGGVTGKFVTVWTVNWWILLGIALFAAVVGWLITALVKRQIGKSTARS